MATEQELAAEIGELIETELAHVDTLEAALLAWVRS